MKFPAYKKQLLSALLTMLFLFTLNTAKANTPQKCQAIIERGIDAMWKKDHVKSLELLTQARNMAERNRWYKQQFLAINNIGANYYEMLDYGEALNYYLESYSIALKHLDPSSEMVVLNNIAILYSKEENYEKAGEYFKKAYDIAKENNNSIKIGLYAMNLGSMANETKDTQKAKKYILESLPYLRTDKNLYTLGLITLAQNDLLTGNAKRAREKAEELFKTSTDLNFNNIGTQLAMIIIEANIQEGNFGVAEKAAKNLIKANKNNADIKKAGFDFLSRCYMKTKRYILALQYKDSVRIAEKQLNDIKNGRLFENTRVKFEIQNYKNQIAVNEAKMASERRLFYSVIAFIVAFVTVAVFFLRNLLAKHKQKKIIAERNQKVTALELEKEKTENLLLEKQISEKETSALLEQERLKNEIEARNRKLSAKALYLSGRNELIANVIATLSQLPELSKNQSLAELIKNLKGHLKTEDEWDTFITHFEEVNHGFINQLKSLHPSLTSNDIRFISYIYMNLSTKEIAAMLNITPEACRKRKERIVSKMNLPENTPLYDYLSTF